MNVMTKTDSVSDALRASCMKARIYSSAFGLSVTVQDASREVERDAGAVRGAARVVANKLAGVDKLHKAVVAAQKYCADALYSRSMPYAGEDGWRLLPTKNFMQEGAGSLLADLGVGKKMFSDALEALEDGADELLAQARSNLGSLDVRLPGKQELVGSYSMRTAFEELPSGLIPGMPEGARQSLQRRVDKALEACATEAKEHVLKSFVRPLESLVSAVKRIEDYEDAKANWREGDPKPTVARFADSLITNIQDLHKNLGSLNVLDDEEIHQLNDMVSALVREVQPNDMRVSDATRQHTGRKAQEVLDHLGGWLSPPKGKPVTP
jgi:hypothetical protein